MHFVVLQHDHPRGAHFDFMLESGGVLRTWALPGPPAEAVEAIAEALPDHRLDYLDYQGPVAGDRGSVVRWDKGTFHWLSRGESELVVELRGTRLAGRATLRRLPDNAQSWRFSFVPADSVVPET